MELIGFLKGNLLAGVLVAASATTAFAEFPERNIEIIHPWGPGNAMAMSQVVAKAMGDELGTDMPVISLLRRRSGYSSCSQTAVILISLPRYPGPIPMVQRKTLPPVAWASDFSKFPKQTVNSLPHYLRAIFRQSSKKAVISTRSQIN